ncbi:retrovirus-related Pol polyprotein from transposon 412 [Trichonephila clavipes]|nr:retrovirus-related Pol polyprotein from transposon 412 [Trichonephila clavipes]
MEIERGNAGSLMAQRQNHEKRNFKCWEYGGTGYLRRNCPRSRKKENTVSFSKQKNYKCLSRAERNYCVTRKELLAIVKVVEHFHPYLYGRRFLLRTDHASLTSLLNFKNKEGQIARWIQRATGRRNSP